MYRQIYIRSGVRGYRLAVRTGWHWPRRVWRFGLIAGELAKARYVTPQSDLSVTFLRAQSDTGDVRPAFWSRLARGGVDVRSIDAEGISHATMMQGRLAELVAAELDRSIDETVGEASDAKRQTA